MPETTPNNTEQRAKLAIIGIRYDENSSFTKGAADAPPQIRAALRSDAWNLTTENGTDDEGALSGTVNAVGEVISLPFRAVWWA